MTSLSERLVATLAASLLLLCSASCKKTYACEPGGDVSDLATWKKLAIVPVNEQTLTCVAKPKQVGVGATLKLVATTPPAWPITSKTIEANAERQGWSLSRSKAATYKVEKDGYQATFEKCRTTAGRLECQGRLLVSIFVPPPELFKNQPYVVEATYYDNATATY